MERHRADQIAAREVDLVVGRAVRGVVGEQLEDEADGRTGDLDARRGPDLEPVGKTRSAQRLFAVTDGMAERMPNLRAS